jgi:hypothetical protein
MSSSQHPGTSLEATLNVVRPWGDRSASRAGAGISSTIGALDPDDTNRLGPTDTLSHFSLGPC